MDVDGTFGGGGGLADSFYQGNDSKFSVAEATFQCPTSMYFKTVSSKMVAGIDVNSQVPLKMLNEEMRNDLHTCLSASLHLSDAIESIL